MAYGNITEFTRLNNVRRSQFELDISSILVKDEFYVKKD